MSEPAVFIMIQDGQARYYGDQWANTYLFREILWGADELQTWLTASLEIDEWPDEVCGGVVVDFDQRKLVWGGDEEMLDVPRVSSVYDKLLRAAWPGFQVEYAMRGLIDLAVAAGRPDTHEFEDETPQRMSSVWEAAGYGEEGDDEGRQDVGPIVDDEDIHAWVTVIDSEGAVRHRSLMAVSEDLVNGNESAVAQFADLPAAEIPDEAVVTEGMWIDQPRREIGFWGGRMAELAYPQMEGAWDGWTVRWIDDGYNAQCAVSGPDGVPMSDAEALGRLMPIILSTKRFDMETMFRAVGGQLKKTAIKATGCLLMVLCAPVILFGVISGNSQAALITVGIVAACVCVVFKVLESKLKRNFAMPEDANQGRAEQSPPVVGPLDPNARRKRVEQLLKLAELPPLSQIEPHFADDTIDELL